MRKFRSSVLPLLAVAALALHGVPAHGSDALVICTSGVPFAYPNGGADIPFNPDRGPLGPLTNAQGVAAVTAAFQTWADVPTASATFLNGGLMPFDVDITNFGPILNPVAPDGLSPIVFDGDGSIFNLLFGPNSGILGFAGPDFGNFGTCELIEGSAFLNGPEFADLTVAEDIMFHEYGHYINLGHVELNGQLVNFGEGGDDTGPTPDNATFGLPADLTAEVIETMYPFYFGPAVGTRTPHADDVASISNIYPEPSFAATTGTITGAILAPDGVTRLSGVNVIARNINDPFLDAVSTFSGAFTDGTAQSDPNVGLFTLSNLTPGEQYAVFVDQVTAAAGRFSNPILIQLPGPEEFWNGANESSDPLTDDPLDFVLITAAAGSTASGTDIIFNQPGEGDPLPVGDDGFVSLFMPFTFTICDQDFNQVFVNANGSLTFGEGDADFTESTGEFLDGPPRVAGLWDDLNPTTGGSVFFTTTNNTFSVTWEDVPEWFATGSNTFTITLKKDANEIEIDYGNVDALDGLAGVSCGCDVTGGLEQPTELVTVPNSRTINFNDETAIFELGAGSDLDFYSLKFVNQAHPLMDKNEPNNSLAKATPINLPFNTAANADFTAIAPAGGDVDFYSFTADEDDTFIAEVVRGKLDSILGVFDSGGNLLNDPVADDDAGVGLLSRTQVSIPADGTYFVAVSYCCDFGFTGTGPGQDPDLDGGRYVVDAVKFAGLPIILGDDDFEEVDLEFSFPFRGNNYSSVFINSNGSLTFGGGDTDFSESVGEFLAENPRIAPLWDDLSPNQGGQVLANSKADSFTVTFADVPQFIAGDSNNFAVTLNSDGTFTVAFGNVDALDGLVGFTEGGGAANPGETDLSAASGPVPIVATVYEQFTGVADPFDLDGAVVDHVPVP